MSSKFALTAGTIINGSNFSYRIVSVLGQGSFGITYLVELVNAEGTSTNIRLAMKEFFMNEINGREGTEVTCNNENGIFNDYRESFLKKAERISGVNNENLIKISDCFEVNNTAYFTKHFVEGGTLESLMGKKGRLSEVHALEIASLLSQAVKALHDKGIAHLDIRPGNIMMISGLVPVLIDFGIPHHINSDDKPETITRVGFGTPGYAPLELTSYRDEANYGEAIDVYGLGATLFRMLSGERPPQAVEILNVGFPEDMLKGAEIDSRTLELLKRSMAPTVGDRMSSVADFHHTVREILESKYGVMADSSISEVINTPLPAPAPVVNSTDDDIDIESTTEGSGEDADSIEIDELQSERKRELPVWLYVLCALGIIVVGLVIYFFTISGGKESVVTETPAKDSIVAEPVKDTTPDTTSITELPSTEEAQQLATKEAMRQAANEKLRKAREERRRAIRNNAESKEPAKSETPKAEAAPVATPTPAAPPASGTTEHVN